MKRLRSHGPNAAMRFGVLSPLAVLLIGCRSGAAPNSVGSEPGSVITHRGHDFEVWGRRGREPGQFIGPRAVVADRFDHVYVLDSTGRIQKFSITGRFLRQWRMPEIKAGKPESLGIDPNGNLVVPDTHYHRVMIFSPNGERLRQWGGRGDEKRLEAAPGDFIFVNGATASESGRIFTTEYGGSFARVQEFTREGKLVRSFSSYGVAAGQFRRPGGPCLDRNGHLVICDQPNHRVQVFAADGKLVRSYGKPGSNRGELSYPYSVAVDGDGNYHVAEWGNHRVQKFTRDWQSVALWGTGGTQPGELYHPWGVAVDSKGFVYVADHENHRVQKFRFPASG